MEFKTKSPSKPPYRSKLVPSESNIIEMIDKLKSARSAKEMDVNCQSVLRYLTHEVKIGRNRILDQIAFLKGEKEMALNQSIQREEDIKRLKHQLDYMKTEYKLIDKQRVKTLQSQLQAAITDRDTWKEKVTDLEDVCESLQLVNTLQKKFSNDSDVISQYEEKLSEVHVALMEEKKNIEHVMIERDDLCRKLSIEKDRANSLQRLVEVLKNEVTADELASDGSYV